jgi:hypothetical protein
MKKRGEISQGCYWSAGQSFQSMERKPGFLTGYLKTIAGKRIVTQLSIRRNN